ncbi:MAG TPA: carbamoyl-phosphate synthase large subunit [Tepidisphaeraceae bacterium]|nr:carbamoyl-phosphate synthase large subunit [Tepidisphaeraceae bacterium]
MPRRTDIHSILIIGSGPIVIGQGCEFDYSGVQACRALKEEGYRVVLINSNPATIMTDPEFADATYIEPITPEAVEKILAYEKAAGHPIDAVLPTLGGQTGLNTAMACYDRGVFTKYGVEMIGAKRDAIHRGEDRQVFKDLMIKIGLKVPASAVVHSLEEGRKAIEEIGLPLIIRPAFTLGGTGGGIAYNVEEFETIVQRGLDASPVTEVLIEQSVIGWKEYEMEVMRDKNDNAVIICSIENFDPMGVHTGDSITVAPIQTLSDKEYQRMRDASIAIIRAVGVETGGSNIQFGINPDNGEMIVIEMNPRVSRSSALASKATGYPIAKLAAKLAVGYTLDELPNYIASKRSKDGKSWDTHTSACFEPSIDYCVIKIPRWTFEKFPDADETLTTQMKSVGEAMAIGRTFKEALQKGIRSMEVKRFGFGLDKYDKWLNSRITGVPPVPPNQANSQTSTPTSAEHGRDARDTGKLPSSARNTSDDSDKTTQGESTDHEWPIPDGKLRRKLAVPSQGRMYYIRYAMKMGWTVEQIHELTNIDPWFLAQMKQLVDFEEELTSWVAYFLLAVGGFEVFGDDDGATKILRRAKEFGYSDVQLAEIWRVNPKQLRRFRQARGIRAVYKLVDTCAAEFEAATPYYYSTYETPYSVVGSASADAGSTSGGNSASAKADPTERTTDDGRLTTSEDEIRLTDRPKVIIIGGGPNRIGQGIEFDYCCVQAAFAMKELGLESVMINSNPETVSTDYDTSDLLFFEPLTHEDVLNVCERLNGGPFEAQYVRNFTSQAVPGAVLWNIDHGMNEEGDSRRVAILQVEVKPAWKDKPPTLVLHLLTSRLQLVCHEYDLGIHKLLSERDTEIADLVPHLDQQLWSEARSWVQRPPSKNLVKGVIVQFGGQTPLNLARGLMEAGVPILGTTVESLEVAGDREQFRTLLQELNLKQPENGIARSVAEAREIAKRIGYPVLVRPSFVLGGRAMEIVSDENQLNYYMANAVDASTIADAPILVDKFLDAATEVDVDCLADYDPRGEDAETRRHGDAVTIDTEDSVSPSPHHPITASSSGQAMIIGVMEHIEEAGIHSGDSACSLPPYSLPKEIVAELKHQTKELARALRVRGLMNVQYAIKDGEIYLIEVNPRASRTVPFVSKAQGQSFAKIAAKVMAGKSLKELGIVEPTPPRHMSVKEVVFPFSKFPGVDIILGPEMRSTGEVMGIDQDFPMAYAKAQIAAGTVLPTKGAVFISVRDGDKDGVVSAAKLLADIGFQLIATGGTHDALKAHGIPTQRVSKLAEGRPNIRDLIKNGKVQLIINTPTKKGPQTDEGKIRALAVLNKVPIVTTITGANAVARAIQAIQKQDWGVRPLQAYFASAR